MKDSRCFKNLIVKASAVFACLGLAFSASGCGDTVRDYLEANNLVNQDYSKRAEEEQSQSLWEELPEEEKEDTERGAQIPDMGAEKSDTPEQNSDAGNQTTEDDGQPDEAKADEGSEENDLYTERLKTTQAGDENSEKGTTDNESTAGDTSKSEIKPVSGQVTYGDPDDDGQLDVEKVNKAIDDLIAQIEQETGRTGRRSQDVEETEEGATGKDATTYFSDTYQNAQRNSLGISEVDIYDLKKAQAGRYAFEHLTDEGKTLYVELLRIIERRAEDIVVSTLDEDVLDVVCQFVLADHPELFYMDGYTYTRYTIGGVLKKISFTGNYIYNAEEIASRQAAIDQYVTTCLAGAPVGGDDYSKVKYVYDYLITNTEYDATAPDNQNICSVFLTGRSVCQGYAKATQYLLNKLGVPTTMVTGKVNGVGHAWNLVYADGEYTYVDTTWGDSSYQRTESAAYESQKMPLINYTYLCCTTQDISRTHVIAETLPMPECTSMRNNYYVREGEYFTELDLNALGALFSRRYADGSNNVTIKCSTREIYDEIIGSLINNQQVFGYMQGSNNTVSYTTFDNQYIIIFWLY